MSEGDDTIDGGAGSDNLDGNYGIDTLSEDFSNASENIVLEGLDLTTEKPNTPQTIANRTGIYSGTELIAILEGTRGFGLDLDASYFDYVFDNCDDSGIG